MTNTRRFFLPLAAAALIVGVVLALPELASRMSYAVEAGRATAASERLQGVRDLSNVFRDVAKTAKPSVVSIRSTQVVRSEGRFGGRDPFRDSPLRDFFGDRLGRPSVPDSYKRSGQGSGVIISEDGYIVTNNHVVADASEIQVRLSDDRTVTAEIVGTDPKTDLAVIKIDAKGLLPARLGDSESLEAGDWVLAIGSPFGLRQTLTAGIVSAKGRANVGIVDYENFIQTDAAINPGNSGGPLLNLRGEVVGINTAIFSRSGGYMGIGFSIPANMVRKIQRRLIEDGEVTRGFLGVMIRDLDDESAEKLGLDGDRKGAVVAEIVERGPADQAGLRAGDVIVEIDGDEVRDSRSLRDRIAAVTPGDNIGLSVLRRGAPREVEVRVGKLPETPHLRR